MKRLWHWLVSLWPYHRECDHGEIVIAGQGSVILSDGYYGRKCQHISEAIARSFERATDTSDAQHRGSK